MYPSDIVGYYSSFDKKKSGGCRGFVPGEFEIM